MLIDLTRDDLVVIGIIFALVVLPSQVPVIGNFLGRKLKGPPRDAGTPTDAKP